MQHNNELETVRDELGSETSQFLTHSSSPLQPQRQISETWHWFGSRYGKKACFVFLSVVTCMIFLLSKSISFVSVFIVASSLFQKASSPGTLVDPKSSRLERLLIRLRVRMILLKMILLD